MEAVCRRCGDHMEMHLPPSPASVLAARAARAGSGAPGQAVAAVLGVPVVPMMNPRIVPGARSLRETATIAIFFRGVLRWVFPAHANVSCIQA